MASSARIQLEGWLKTIDVPEGLVIDVGGAQKPVRGRTRTWKAEEYRILDLENPHEGPRPHIIGDIDERGTVPCTDASVVFALEIMEYMLHPADAVRNMADMLRPGGALHISFPFLYPIHKPVGTDFLRYTEDGALALLVNAGLKVEEVRYRIPGSEEGRRRLMQFWDGEGMRHLGDETAMHTGYLITARKI